MTVLKVHSHSHAIEDVFYLLNGHFYGETKRDITVVLDRDDMLEFVKTVNINLYKTASINVEGEYFYVSSSVEGSEIYIESVETDDGRIKYHEGDILILPHYVPQEVKAKCVDGSDTVIELALESVYEKLAETIKH